MNWKELDKNFIEKHIVSYSDNFPKTIRYKNDKFFGNEQFYLYYDKKYYSVKDIIRHSLRKWNEENNSNINTDQATGGCKSKDGAGYFLYEIGFNIVDRQGKFPDVLKCELDINAESGINDEEELFNISSKQYRNLSGQIRVRSRKFAEIAIKKANGKCQNCNQPAPFKKKDGTLFLEAHHVDELSKGGIDHPENMIALCPNCHRNIHIGKDGHKINEKLRKIFCN